MTQNDRPAPTHSTEGANGPFEQLAIPDDVMPAVEPKPWRWPALGRAAVRPQEKDSSPHDNLDQAPRPDELNFPAIRPLIPEGAAWAKDAPPEFAPATLDDLREVYGAATSFLDQVPVEDTAGHVERVAGDINQGYAREVIRGRTVHLRTRDGRPVKIDQTQVVAPYPRAPHGIRITFQLNKGEQLTSTTLPTPATKARSSAEPVPGIDSHVTAQYILDDLQGATIIPEVDFKLLERDTYQRRQPGETYDQVDNNARKFMRRIADNWKQEKILQHVRAQQQDQEAA